MNSGDDDRSLASLRLRLEELETALASAPGADASLDRDRARSAIVSLFRDTERLIDELTQLKEEIRPLVERYKTLYPAPKVDSAGGAFRVDHLGNSTYRERGWNALAGGDDERAARELRRALALAPEEPRTRVLLGWALVRVGEAEEAEKLVESVLEWDTDHPLARMVLGYLRLKQGRAEEAIASLSAVLSRGTDRTAVLYANLYLGVVYSGRGSHREAQGFFRSALDLGPNLTEAYLELGRSYFSGGRLDLAVEAWKAGGSNPYNPWGERCREALERLAGHREPPSP